MEITRNKGIVDIKLNLADNPKKEEKARLTYNKLCFLINIIIPLIDELEETNVYRHDVKFHANKLREKLIPMSDQHHLAYTTFGNVPNGDKEVPAEQILQITSKAYDNAIEWLFNRPPHHIVSSLTAIKKMEEKQPDLLNKIETVYEPIKL